MKMQNKNDKKKQLAQISCLVIMLFNENYR